MNADFFSPPCSFRFFFRYEIYEAPTIEREKRKMYPRDIDEIHFFPM